jgi:hypothetical protein
VVKLLLEGGAAVDAQEMRYRVSALTHAVGRNAKLIAEGSGESFMRAIARVQRHGQDVGRALCKS